MVIAQLVSYSVITCRVHRDYVLFYAIAFPGENDYRLLGGFQSPFLIIEFPDVTAYRIKSDMEMGTVVIKRYRGNRCNYRGNRGQ